MRVSALEGHRLWAPYYDADTNPVLALESRALRALLSPIASKRFIDVACGTGRWMAYLRERGATVFGIDFCVEMLGEAERKPFLCGRSAVGEAASLPFNSDVADAALCSFAAGYFPDLERAVTEMARITKRGGRVIISDLHPEGVAAGWRRSFHFGSGVYEMEHFSPSVDDLRTAAECAGLQLHIQIEAHFGERERRLFRAAGKEQMFPKLAATPAVWMGIWIKP